MPYRDKEENRKYQREWKARRRAEWFEGKTCVDCGSDENLEIDHIDPSSKDPRLVGTNLGTGTIWSWSKERREAELAKCVVRCSSCHKHKTKENRESPRGERHGNSKYSSEFVESVRARHELSGETFKEIAEDLNLSSSTVRDWIRRRTWL